MLVNKNVNILQARLISLLRRRVQNGEVTERGFARKTGISQSHVNRVLKGTRTLSIDNFIHILTTLNYSVLDLYSETELRGHLKKLAAAQPAPLELPFLDARIGPRRPWREEVRWQERLVIPSIPPDPRRQLILVRLDYDPDMKYSTDNYNIAVLETPPSDWPIDPESIFAVDRAHDTVLRRLRRGRGCLYLLSDADMNEPVRWERVRDSSDGSAILRGKLIWLGRDERQDPHGSHARLSA